MATLVRGSSVGRYMVLGRIGVGSMGVVVAAYDPELNRRVALKLLRTDVAIGERPATQLRTRLVREAQALAQLAHPHVIAIHDVGTEHGEVFLAMELVEGGTLARWLHETPRPFEAVLEKFRQAGEGLQAAHAAGIVHRDFKPENVLLGADGRVRVSDFGLARASGDALPLAAAPPGAGRDSDGAALTATATRTGALVGTPAYMAPEQWAGRPSDARTDVFAFCVALYEGLYGERPFGGHTTASLAAAVASNQVRPAPPSTRVPSAVRRALLRGLRADPAERHASMRALLDELVPARRGRGWMTAGLVVAVGAAIAGLAFRRPEAPVCQTATADWGDVFGAAHDQAVHRALTQTASPSAEGIFATVRQALQRYGSAWIAMRTDACQATHVRGQQSEALLDLRMQCLDERRRAAAAFVASIETGAGEGLVERAARGVADLARVDDCADTRALAEPVPMPADPAKRARVVSLAERAADAEGAAIEAAAGLAVIEPLLAEGRELGWQPLVARLEYDRAMRLSQLRRNREAEIELQDAAIAAEQAHADAILLDVWTRLLYLVGYQEYRVADGLLWGRYAQAALARHGGDDHRAGRLFEFTGLVLLNDESRLEEARDDFQHALDLARKVDGPASDGVASAMTELSMVLFTMGRPEEALPFERDARAIMERLRGPESIDVALSLGNEGEELLESGHPDEALPLLERSAAMQERLGRNDASVLGVIGRALRRKGRLSDALDLDQRTLVQVGRNEPPDAYDLSFPNVAVALDLLALGRGKEALPFAEYGARLRQVTTTSSERGEARFALARALWESGSPARAREQGQGAREDYRLSAERYGSRFRKARDEIEAWLAAHGA